MNPPRDKDGDLLSLGVAIPAAGTGERMGGVKKPFLQLRGEPLLAWALKPFLSHPQTDAVAVALAKGELDQPPGWLEEMDPRIRLVEGGETRGDSVWAALEALPDTVDLVAVHDAARPLLSGAVLDRCVREASRGRGAVAGVPAIDTLKEVDEGGRILGTPRREAIWHAQTPQVFPRELLVDAYRKARELGMGNTDDAALVEAAGGDVVMVLGGPENLKVTRPEDLPLAEFFLGRGQG